MRGSRQLSRRISEVGGVGLRKRRTLWVQLLVPPLKTISKRDMVIHTVFVVLRLK